MKRMIFAVLVLTAVAFAAERYVSGRGSATDLDQGRARAEAMEQAKENLENACSNGRIVTLPEVTTDDCHMAGPGSVTCVVEITATCDTN